MRPCVSADRRVIRVRSAETIAHPKLKALILRAIAAVEYPGTTPQELYAEMAGAVGADHFGLFAGIKGREPLAVAAAVLPTTPVQIAAQGILVYSEGPPELMRMIAGRAKAWLLEHGQGKLLAHNFYRDDAVFARAFRHFGQARRIATLFEVTF